MVSAWILAAVCDWPAPTSLSELRKFLGLTNYFRKFISKNSFLAAPLTSLTRKDAFQSPDAWTPECQAAFDAIKCASLMPRCKDLGPFCCRMGVPLHSPVRSSHRRSGATLPVSKSSWLSFMRCVNGVATW
ncbi:hypothetical protein Vafri_22171, partial [Volvox africanus]